MPSKKRAPSIEVPRLELTCCWLRRRSDPAFQRTYGRSRTSPRTGGPAPSASTWRRTCELHLVGGGARDGRTLCSRSVRAPECSLGNDRFGTTGLTMDKWRGSIASVRVSHETSGPKGPPHALGGSMPSKTSRAKGASSTRSARKLNLALPKLGSSRPRNRRLWSAPIPCPGPRW